MKRSYRPLAAYGEGHMLQHVLRTRLCASSIPVLSISCADDAVHH